MANEIFIIEEENPHVDIPVGVGSGAMLPIVILKITTGTIIVADLNIPPDVDVTVMAFGAGGGGAGGPPGASPGGGGGGAGAFVAALIPAAVWATVDSIEIGVGTNNAVANTDGAAGLDTVISAGATDLIIAGGGAGGLVALGAGGAGGVATVHESVTTIQAADGADGATTATAAGGAGGRSPGPGSGVPGAGGGAGGEGGGTAIAPGGGGGGGSGGGTWTGGRGIRGQIQFSFMIG